ncbi:MAG: zinc-binding dehydrogenase [Caldilineaceae bacterium]
MAAGLVAAAFGGGTIGLFALQVASDSGRTAPGDRAGWRRDWHDNWAPGAAIDPTAVDPVAELRRLTGGIGPDLVLEAAGAAPVTPVAIHAVRKGGRIVLVGIPVAPSTFNFFDVVFGEKEIIGSLSHVYDEDYATAVRWLGDGRIHAEPMISVRIPLERLVEDGLQRLAQRATETLKVIIKPHGA